MRPGAFSFLDRHMQPDVTGSSPRPVVAGESGRAADSPADSKGDSNAGRRRRSVTDAKRRISSVTVSGSRRDATRHVLSAYRRQYTAAYKYSCRGFVRLIDALGAIGDEGRLRA